jgi:putative transposase
MRHSYTYRFNRTHQNDVLDLYLFRSLTEMRGMTSAWIVKYKEDLPHDALQEMALFEYLTAKMTRGNF